MVQWMILSVGLMMLVQCIDASPGKAIRILYANSSTTLTFYRNFNYTDKEFKVSLIRGTNKSEPVCVGSFTSTLMPFNISNCLVTPSASHVTFFLWGLNENNTNIYFFRKEVMYPPPYTSEYDEGTIILIPEPMCGKQQIIEIQKSSLSLLVTVGGFVLYSLIITTALLYILVYSLVMVTSVGLGRYLAYNIGETQDFFLSTKREKEEEREFNRVNILMLSHDGQRSIRVMCLMLPLLFTLVLADYYISWPAILLLAFTRTVTTANQQYIFLNN